MSNQLDRIIDIIKRTGDKVIVIKDDSEFVISSLDSYSNLIEGQTSISQLSEGEMLNKINRDIAFWRESQRESENTEQEFEVPDNSNIPHYDALNPQVQQRIDSLLENQSTDKDTNNIEDILVEEPDFNLLGTQDQIDNYEYENLHTNQAEPAELENLESVETDQSTPEQILDITGPTKELAAEQLAEEPQLIEIQADQIAEDKPKKTKTNNFGYTNPSDTDNEKPLSEDYWLKLDKKTQTFNDFDHIPPPPDMQKN